jgi:hypothetical protein
MRISGAPRALARPDGYRIPPSGRVSVLVSVGLSAPCVHVLIVAREEDHERSVNTGVFRNPAFPCASVPDVQK